MDIYAVNQKTGAMKRLTEGGRGGMGSMFKVVAISDPALAHSARRLLTRRRLGSRACSLER